MKTIIGLLGVILVVNVGGCCLYQRTKPPPCPPPYPGGIAAPVPVSPGGAFPSGVSPIPPAAPPPGSSVIPPPAPSPGFPPPPPPASFEEQRQLQSRWLPADPKVNFAAPQQPAPQQPVPQATERVAYLLPPVPDTPEPKEPSRVTPAGKNPVPALPVGIPQFTEVKDKVAAGLRPSLDDGLDWLGANGYRTVIFLRAPGEPDSADRKQVEKRGMSFVTLEVGPATLTRHTLDAFNRLLADSANQPIFVYDRDGSLAGTLWYLHFRSVEETPDDAARIRAASLGFRNEHSLFPVAQKILADR